MTSEQSRLTIDRQSLMSAGSPEGEFPPETQDRASQLFALALWQRGEAELNLGSYRQQLTRPRSDEGSQS